MLFRPMRNIFLLTRDLSLVGFTGSGQQMRKDPGRSRHVYQQEEDTY